MTLDAIVECPSVNFECTRHRLYRPVDHRVIVRIADHERRRQHAALDQFLQEKRPELLRRLTVRIARAIEHCAGSSGEGEVALESVVRDGLPDAAFETAALAIERADNVLAPIDLDDLR